MNSFHRSVWDSLNVNPSVDSKPAEKQTPQKVLTRRNGDLLLSHSSDSAKVLEHNCESQGNPSKINSDKRHHSDSVFDYLRELQDGNEKIFKSVLRTNNSSVGRPNGPQLNSQPTTNFVDLSDDRVPSEGSTDEGSAKASSVSPASMDVSQSTGSTLSNVASAFFRVEVKETYQFAFVMNNDPSSMAIPECADSFEASYQIQATLDKSGAMDIPVNFEPQLFLPENRSSFDEFLRDAIDSFLHEVQCQINKSRQLLYINDQVSCHEESVNLRRRVFHMICTILPDLSFQSHFDCTSPHMDRLLDYVEEVLTGELPSDSLCIPNKEDSPCEGSIQECFVDLCDDPVVCLARLKSKILRVIHLLLPQLKLPDTFDIDKDLVELMRSIIHCSR